MQTEPDRGEGGFSGSLPRPASNIVYKFLAIITMTIMINYKKKYLHLYFNGLKLNTRYNNISVQNNSRGGEYDLLQF